jgi:hypothetical protein
VPADEKLSFEPLKKLGSRLRKLLHGAGPEEDVSPPPATTASAAKPAPAAQPAVLARLKELPIKPSLCHERLADLYRRMQNVGSRDEVANEASLRKLEPVAILLKADAQTRVRWVRYALNQICQFCHRSPENRRGWYWNWEGAPWLASRAVDLLLRTKPPLTLEDFIGILPRIGELESISPGNETTLRYLITSLETLQEDQKADPQLREALEVFKQGIARWVCRSRRQLLVLLDNVLAPPGEPHLFPGEAWADLALAEIAAAEKKRAAWKQLLFHCESATGAAPTTAWLESAQRFVDELGWSEFTSRIAAWFPRVDDPRTVPLQSSDPFLLSDPNQSICQPNGDILKGLAWGCGLHESPDLARALTALALSSYRKLPGIGPRLVRVGNACVWALGHMPGTEGITQLAILRVRVKFGTAQKLIEKAMNSAAQRVGLPREDLEEMAVPAYGLAEVGLRREQLGDCTAEVAVTPRSDVELRWFKADGKPVKSVPASVKKNHAEDLKELKTAAKDIERMLSAQRERLDQLFLQQKSWPLATWQERYLDHPLIGTLARRLIWRFTHGKRAEEAAYLDANLVDAKDRPVDWLNDETQVQLWHPIHAERDGILAWREWLETHEIRQPFKQAHREIYLLTDAERATGTYSNRYAAHMLKQHQFNALCAARGWKNSLRLMVDQDFPPAQRLLPQWGLRAEFWIEGIGAEYGHDTNEAGTFYHVSTDQVRFYALDSAASSAHAGGGGYDTRNAGEPIPLDQIPPLVFSEIMRDVDLFVGVASVGNDPTWQDGGPQGRYRDYWQEYSFGQLTESAQTRRAVLQRLIPKLKIADRCSFNERFLVVRGDLRTYKIHLGSGNILMEPDDQYLCIVARQAPQASGRVFLPFEGDRILSVILSKAMLLAEDTRITDPTILSQIGGRPQ